MNIIHKNPFALPQKIAVLALCMVFAGILFTCNKPENDVTFPPCPDEIADVEAKMQEYLKMEYSMYIGETKRFYQVSPNKMMIQRFDRRIDSVEIWNTGWWIEEILPINEIFMMSENYINSKKIIL